MKEEVVQTLQPRNVHDIPDGLVDKIQAQAPYEDVGPSGGSLQALWHQDLLE